VPFAEIRVETLSFLRAFHMVVSASVNGTENLAMRSPDGFHDVDLTAVRPTAVAGLHGHHPDRRPSADTKREFGAHLDTSARPPGGLAFSRKLARCIVFPVEVLAFASNL